MSALSRSRLWALVLGGLLAAGCQSAPQTRAQASPDPDSTDAWLASRMSQTAKPPGANGSRATPPRWGANGTAGRPGGPPPACPA